MTLRTTLRIVREAFSVWWDALMHFSFFNMIWVLAQILVVTGPPATAAMYALVERYRERDPIIPMDFLYEMRRVFLPAWKWGVVNILIVGVLVLNFVGSLSQSGNLWFFLRYVWLLLGVLWYVVNLFYWPFWYSQKDRSIINTYRNAFVLFLRMPVAILTISTFCVALLLFSLVTLFPLALALMVWLASIGTLTVQLAVEEIGRQEG